MLSSLVRTFHANLHWNALLIALVFEGQSRLWIWAYILSHAMRGNPFSVLFFLQRKSLFILCKCVVVDLSSWKHWMVWARRDSKWDWINTIQLAFDKQFTFWPSSLAVALLIIPWKVVRVGFFWKTGQHRYFASELLWLVLKIPATSCLCTVLAFFENVSTDLW